MPAGYTRIVVPVDFSPSSDRALREARKILRDRGEISLLHVTRHMDPALPWSAANRRVVAGLSRQAKADARSALDEMAAKLRGVRVHPRVVEGVAHEKILAEAKRFGADAVVMGAQGHTLTERLMIGSTAERVVRKATLPVLVVPRPRRR